MLHPWDESLYTTRAWCLFELFTSIQNRETVDIRVILTPEQGKAFHDTMAAAGYGAIDAALERIRAEDATATVPADLEAITAHVNRLPGGFKTLDVSFASYRYAGTIVVVDAFQKGGHPLRVSHCSLSCRGKVETDK